MTHAVALIALALALAAVGEAKGVPLIADDRPSEWSGHGAQILAATDPTPDQETPLRYVWSPPQEHALPSMARSFTPVKLSGDVVAFWLRVDHPIARMRVILLDRDDVGAEIEIPALLRADGIEPGKWHYVVWPFRTNPGWVRYTRGQVDWDHVRGVSLYTWPEELQQPLTVDLGPMQALSYTELEAVFEAHPERVCANRGLPWRVIAGKRTDRMMAEYFALRGEAKLAELRAKWPPARLARDQAKVRVALAATYLMPPVAAKPESKLLRVTQVDGVAVEHRLLKMREGLYSTALVFLPYQPADGTPPQRYPAVLSLPGHGDPSWSGVNQERCLTLAKRGYVTLWVQPFGQMESGDEPTWNEAHGGQSMAYLLTTGQSLMGIIMASHRAEVTDLSRRSDVDASEMGVTGMSMGGTHTVWLSAIEERLKVGVAVSVAPVARPDLCFMPHCLCDLMVGGLNVADEEMLMALSAPRPLMQVFPNGEVPLTPEGERLLLEGWIGHDEAVAKYSLNAAQLTERHRYARDAYAAAGAPDGFDARVVAGPHSYTQAMRETAAGWLDHTLRHTAGTAPVPDPPVAPIRDSVKAIAALNLWPDGHRPPEVLSPTAYTQHETAALIARLPSPPGDLAGWQASRPAMASEVRTLLGVELSSPDAMPQEVGRFQADGTTGYKLLVSPERGIEVPMLLFEPRPAAKPDGRLVVLLDPAGMSVAAGSPERTALTDGGAWVLCADLRGMGETRHGGETGGYMGYRDLDLCMTTMKFGETVAGYWVKDLLAAIRAALRFTAHDLSVTVHGDLETGLIAVLAAGQSDLIQAVEADRLLASYHSAGGYGLTFAYADDNDKQAVRNRPLRGYGTAVPCIPSILKYADIPQLAALVAPRPLTLRGPLGASGDAVGRDETQRAFAWTRAVYRLLGAARKLRIEPGP